MTKDHRPKTIICDIDGIIFRHWGSAEASALHDEEVLPGVKEMLLEWERKGYNVILITGRRKSARKRTKRQLNAAGIFYDKLIMGVGGGERILINDAKPDGRKTAKAIVIDRNKGLKGIDVD